MKNNQTHRTYRTILKRAVALALLVSGVGCSTFSTTQTDTRYEEGKPATSISTKVSARTFWDSKSALASFTASQTEKSQSAKVGSLNQESSGTNAVQFLSTLVELLKQAHP